MNFKKTIYLSLTLILLVGLGSASWKTIEDFEDGDTAEWTTVSGSSSNFFATTESNKVGSGTYAGQLNASDNNQVQEYVLNDAKKYKNITFHFGFDNNQAGDTNSYNWRLYDSNGNEFMIVRETGSGTTLNGNSINDIIEGNYYRFEAYNIDYSTDTFDWKIVKKSDGTNLDSGTGTSFKNPGSDFSKIDIRNDDTDSSCCTEQIVDNIRVKSQESTDLKFYDFQPTDGSTAWINGNQEFNITIFANSTEYDNLDVEGYYDNNLKQTFTHPADGNNKTFSFTVNDLNNTGLTDYRFEVYNGTEFIADTKNRNLDVKTDPPTYNLKEPNDGESFLKGNSSINVFHDWTATAGNNESFKFNFTLIKPNGSTTEIANNIVYNPNEVYDDSLNESNNQEGTYKWNISGVGQTSGDRITSTTFSYTISDEDGTVNLIQPNPSISKSSDASFNVNKDNQDKFVVINKSIQEVQSSQQFEENCTVDYNNYSGCYKYEMSDLSAFQDAPLILWNQTLERNGGSDFMEFGITYADQANPTVYLVQNGTAEQGNANNAVQFNVPQDDPLVNMSLNYFPSQDKTEINVTNLNNGDFNAVNQSIDPDKPFRVAVGGTDSSTTGNQTAYLFYANSTFDKVTSGNPTAYIETIPYKAEASANIKNDGNAELEFYYDGNLLKTKTFTGDGSTVTLTHNETFTSTLYNNFAQIVLRSPNDNQATALDSSSLVNTSVVQKPEFYLKRPENNSRVEVDNLSDKTGNDETKYEGIINIGEAGKAVLKLKHPNGNLENITSETFTRNNVGDNKTLLDVNQINNISLKRKANEKVLISDYYNWSLDYYGTDSSTKFDSENNIYRYVSDIEGFAETILNVFTGFFGDINDYVNKNLGSTGQFFFATIMILISAGIMHTWVGNDLVTISTITLFTLGFTFADGFYPIGTFWILTAIVGLAASYFGSKVIGGE